MAVTQWNGPQLRMPSVNPNGALQVMNQSLANLGSMVDADRRQDWVEGVPQRAIAEENRKNQLANQAAKLEMDIKNNIGYSKEQDFLNSPAYAAIRAEVEAAGGDFEKGYQNFRTQNKGMFSDIDVMNNEIERQAIAAGKGRNFITQLQNSNTSNLYPVLDPDIAKELFINQTLGGSLAKGATFGGGSSYDAYMKSKEFDTKLEQFRTARNLKPGTKTSMWDYATDLFNMGGRSLNESQLNQTVMKLKGQGMSDDAALFAVSLAMDGGNDVNFNPDNISNADLATLTANGHQYDALRQNSSAIDNRLALFNAGNAYNSSILSRMAPQNATQEDIASSLRKHFGLGAKEAKAAAKEIKTEQNNVEKSGGSNNPQQNPGLPNVDDLVAEQDAATLPDQPSGLLSGPLDKYGDGILPKAGNLVSNALIDPVISGVSVLGSGLLDLAIDDGAGDWLRDLGQPARERVYQNSSLPDLIKAVNSPNGLLPTASLTSQRPAMTKRPQKVGDVVFYGFPKRPLTITSEKQLKALQQQWDSRKDK